MKHQLDTTLYMLYFCRVTLHVSGASAHHQEYLKTSTAATGTYVIVAGKSSHLRRRNINCTVLHQVGVSFYLWIVDVEEDIQPMGIRGWRKLSKERTEWKKMRKISGRWE